MEYNNPNTAYWFGYYDGVKQNTLDFDEFIALCNATGAQPHVNVAVNLNYSQLNSNLAAEWVRYANITNNYNVKYWEIGNEMWHPDESYSYAQVRSIAQSYTAAMKAVDPTIKIGISWHKSWNRTQV